MSPLDGPAGGAVRTTPRCARIATLVLGGLVSAACGSTAEDAVPAGPATASITASAAGTGDGSLVIVRSGGITGVRDTVRVATDGRTNLTDKAGASRGCRPGAEAVARLRAVDLGAVPESGSREAIADGFTYRVRSTTARAVVTAQAIVTEGEKDAARAELLAAAAAILASC